MIDLFQISLELGLLYSLIAISIVISFKYLNIADLTVDGSFTLGAAIVATSIRFWGFDPFTSLFLAIFFGALAGFCTGILSTKFKTDPLLAGILIMTMLYSVNLRVMHQANISLLNTKNIFSFISSFTSQNISYLLFVLLITFLAITFFNYFLKTELGGLFRATGDNPTFVRSLGKNPSRYKIIGLMISNATVALCGGIVAQRQGFADVNMGIGILVIGLASLIIGDAIFPTSKHKILITLLSAVIGSIGYQFALGLALRAGLAASDLKLLTGMIVIVAIGFSKIKFHPVNNE